MNIKFKRFLRMALCLLLCAVFFTGGVFAAGKLQKRKITVYSGVDIYVDDARLDARDANGNPVEVFIYNGTTYLPVRAVGEAVGKAVQWEAKTSSVYIGQHKSDKPAVWLDEFDYFSSTNHALEKLWGDRIFEKCGIGRDEGGDGGKTLEIRGKRRLSARDGGANYQQS